MPDEATWIADGTAETEPETVETPAAEVVETPAPETVETAAVEAPEVAVETVEEVQKFIDGKLGDETFQLPEGVQIPLKRGDETEFVSLQEVMKRGMMERDYTHKSMELGNERRAFETSQTTAAAERVKLEARAKYLEGQEAEIKAALSDPASAAQYQQHLQALQDNPMYRKTWEGRWANQEIEAERDALRASDDARVVEQASTTARGWIESLSTEFDGVDPGRVASIYGQRLSAGQASLDISDVRSIYQAEAEYLQGASQPLRDQLATLSARIDGLTASQTAEEQNETTQHAVRRAKTVPVATGAGAPAKGYVPPEKFGPNELAEQNSRWSKAG